jgi:hypothetical protein
VTVEKAPNRARRKRSSGLGLKNFCDLDLGYVRLGFDRAQDHHAIRLNAVRVPIITLWLGACRPALAPLTKLTALAAETPIRSAAARRKRPPSTAWMSLIRKSSDGGFAMHAGLLPGTQYVRFGKMKRNERSPGAIPATPASATDRQVSGCLEIAQNSLHNRSSRLRPSPGQQRDRGKKLEEWHGNSSDPILI